MYKYRKAFVEVNKILECLSESEYRKIPKDVIEVMRNNQLDDYVFDFNPNKDIREQITSEESKAILFNIFRDYLATEQQHDSIIRMQKEERQKIEENKKSNFKEIFEKEDDEKEYTKELVVVESKFRKIINKIKRFFKNIVK